MFAVVACYQPLQSVTLRYAVLRRLAFTTLSVTTFGGRRFRTFTTAG
jgi:hypothetical protein